MSDIPANSALYCVFHNDHRWTHPDNSPCSHIFSAVVQKGRKGLEVIGQDYDGKKDEVATVIHRRDFNLAALVPIPQVTAQSLIEVVSKINHLGREGVWPFYFSRDMTIKHDLERPGKMAIAPEGHIDPAPDAQKITSYGLNGGYGDPSLMRARINCVRMTILAAQLSGIKVSNIADIQGCFRTGEQVRDALLNKIQQLQQAVMKAPGLSGVVPLFDHKGREAKGKCDSRVVMSGTGLSLMQSSEPVRIDKMLEGLDRKMEGRSLFDHLLADGTHDAPEIFISRPKQVPPYLMTAFDRAGISLGLPEHPAFSADAADDPSWSGRPSPAWALTRK